MKRWAIPCVVAAAAGLWFTTRDEPASRRPRPGRTSVALPDDEAGAALGEALVHSRALADSDDARAALKRAVAAEGPPAEADRAAWLPYADVVEALDRVVARPGLSLPPALQDEAVVQLSYGARAMLVADDEFLLDESPTWGNLVDLEAVDEHVAFALFSTGTGGRLSYTVDGGGTWTAVTYDGSWTDTGTTPPTAHSCTEATFFGKVKGMALVLPGSTTVGVDTNSDGSPDTVDATLYLASRYNTGYSATAAADRCGLARLVLDNGVATWSWVALQRSFTQADCQVDEGNILGVSSPPWTPSSATGPVAYVWGGYSYVPTPATHYGGACTIAADGTDTQLVNPATYSMSIGEVTPAPADTDWLFVAGYTDINAQLEQWKYGAGLGFDPAYPLLIDTSASGGTLELTTTPPSLMGLAAGWGADVTTGDPQLLYATEGSGAWRGYLTW